MGTKLIQFKFLFFLSGAAGLIYEVVWARLFADILGSTALSMTMVFSVFLLALALGAYLFSRSNLYGRAAFLLYVKLEIGIAFSAAFVSAMLILGKSYIAMHLLDSDVFALSVLFQFVVVFLVIGFPTILMGGTLPVILNAVRDWTVPRQIVTQLYGWNTMGAAVGTFLTGFVLIWQLGLSLTILVGVGINLVVAACVLLIAREQKNDVSVLPSTSTSTSTLISRSTFEGRQYVEAEVTTYEQFGWLVFAFFSGFSVLAYEMLWGRLAKFLLGDRTIAITALLFVFIVCLGMGSFFAPIVARICKVNSSQRALRLVAWILFVAGVIHLTMVPIAYVTIQGQGLTSVIAFESQFINRILIMWVLIFPAITVLGLVFPLLAWSAREINCLPGKVVGKLYFVNTVGATVGAVVASFVLTRWVGTLFAFYLISSFLMVGSIIYLFRHSGDFRIIGILVIVLGSTVLIGFWFPHHLTVLRDDERLVDYNEDEYGIQTLTLTTNGKQRVRNNRLQLIYDLGHWQTTHAQQMAAHLTTLLAKQTGSVLNIGTGYGITAGTFTLYPDVDAIETIEILPFLVRHQQNFSHYNFNYFDDDRVHLYQGDGRHALVTSDKSYDIISVNVLDPYLPGSSSLYTVEMWQAVFDHLRPGGVYTQLFWGEDISLLIKGLNTVFSTVLYFPAYNNTSFNVIGFKEDVLPDSVVLHLDRISPKAEKELRRILNKKDIKEELTGQLEQSWRKRDYFNDLANKNSGALHTDNLPILEFRWAHGVDTISVLDSPLVEE